MTEVYNLASSLCSLCGFGKRCKTYFGSEILFFNLKKVQKLSRSKTSSGKVQNLYSSQETRIAKPEPTNLSTKKIWACSLRNLELQQPNRDSSNPSIDAIWQPVTESMIYKFESYIKLKICKEWSSLPWLWLTWALSFTFTNTYNFMIASIISK